MTQIDLICRVKNNTEWLPVFLDSLSLTTDGDLTIYMSCGIDVDVVKRITEKSRFNIVLEKEKYTHVSKEITRLCEMSNSPYICTIDIDLCMLLPNWNVYVNNFIDIGYTMIANACRHTWIGEINFMVVRRDIGIKSEFTDFYAMKEWDTNIVPFPSHCLGEQISTTYYNAIMGGKILLFTKVTKPSRRWGDITYCQLESGDFAELLYHNYYSQRCKELHTIPQEELEKFGSLILNSSSNATEIHYFIKNKFGQMPLKDYLGRFSSDINECIHLLESYIKEGFHENE